MKKKFEDKAVKKFKDKKLKVEDGGEEEKEFFFPLEQKTIRAKNLKEAQEKI